MIIIKVYSNKKSVNTKNSLGIIDIIKDNDNLDAKTIVLNGPMTVGAANAALAVAGLRTLNNVSESEIIEFQSNKDFFGSELEVENNEWVKKSSTSKSTTYIFMLKQAIEERGIRFTTQELSSQDVEKYKTILDNSREELKHGMERITKAGASKG